MIRLEQMLQFKNAKPQKLLLLVIIIASLITAINHLTLPTIVKAASAVETCEQNYTPGSDSLQRCLQEARDNPSGRNLSSCEADQRQRLLGILPKWYKYLPYTPLEATQPVGPDNRCRISVDFRDNPAGVLPIGLAIIEMLLAVAGVVSVAFVIVGGFRYITSQGEPEHTKAALSTIINALIGGAIAIVATALVAFIGGRLGG